MPSYWLLKSEPDEYSYDDLEKEGQAAWDGVRNPKALKNMRSFAALMPISKQEINT